MQSTDFAARQATQAHRIGRIGRLLIGLTILVLLATTVRVGQLKVAPDARLAQFLAPPTSTQRELGRRGDIVDVRGRILAKSVVGYRLFVDPKIVPDLDALATELAPIAGLHPQEILQAVARRPGSRYVVLRQRLEDWQVEAIRHRGASLRGVGIEPHLVRLYPHGETMDAVVGFVGAGHEGRAGIEFRAEEILRPTPGRLTYERDASGGVLWIDEDEYVAKRDGDSVRLTIDVVVQEFVGEVLQRAAREFNARGARAVVLDIETGDIVAIADVLRDRRGFLEVIDDAERRKGRAYGRQRATSDPFEPGSTFKPFVWSAAVDLGKARPGEIIPLPGGLYHTSRGRPIRDVGSAGAVSWETVLVKSLNSGMAFVGERFAASELRDAVRRFGFGERTGCGMPGESAGIMTPPSRWNHHTQTSVPMGQEISVTLVQMARGFSAFCRDGTLVEPRLVVPPGDPTLAGPAPVVRRAISEPAALKTREVMRTAIMQGTGRKADSSRYEVFGKTGTSQLPIPRAMERRIGRRGYFEDRYIANFIAGAPYRQPRIVVAVTIDDPDRRIQHFGGMTAAPTAREIIDFVLSYLGVEPQETAEPEGRLAQR